MRLVPLLALALTACSVYGARGVTAPPPEPLRLQGQWVQGAAVSGQVAPGSQVWFGERALRVSPDGRFVFGLSRDEAPEVRLHVRFPDGVERLDTYTVRQREYEVQKIDGLPQGMVTPPPSALKQIDLDNTRVAAARARDSAETHFAGGYVWPVTGRISGVYGSQRVLNGEPKQPHFGVDIAAGQGTPVKATAAGTVALARSDLYFTGGTIILDHGHGLSSTYLHLSKLNVREGVRVKQGEVIGQVGATGRATGPHLCFRFNWFETRLDAQLLLPPMPGAGN